MPPRRAFACCIVLLVSACATVPVPIPSPAQGLDGNRVRSLLAARLDTLDIDRLRLDYLWEGGHLPSRPPDSLGQEAHRRAYAGGVDRATYDMESGTFRLLTWRGGTPVIGLPRGGDTRCWHLPSVVTGLLWRDFRVHLEAATEDSLDYYSRGVFAEGYNRVAEPVIEAYWDVEDIYSEVWSRSNAVTSGGHEAEFFEWTIAC